MMTARRHSCLVSSNAESHDTAVTSTQLIEDDELWTTAETAAFLRRPPGTLGQWRHRGQGPKSFRLVGQVVYRRSEVLRWVAEQERLAEARYGAD